MINVLEVHVTEIVKCCWRSKEFQFLEDIQRDRQSFKAHTIFQIQCCQLGHCKHLQLQLFALGKRKHSNNIKALAHVNDCARFVIDEQLSIKSHLSFQRVSNTIKLFNLGHFSILNFLSWRNEVGHDGKVVI